MRKRMILTATMLAFALATAGPGMLRAQSEVGQTKDPKNDKHDVSKIGDRDVDGKVNFYSIEKEIALGRQLAAEVERNARIVDDPVISEYVNRVGQNLVRNSDAQVPFTIKVVDDDSVNAFALPGGYFYVNTGIIRLAQSEAELAGVMAHEIAHVTARHGTRQATKGQIANLASIPAAIFLPGGWLGYGVYQGMNLAIPLTFLKFSRNHEKEADFLGLQYLYKTGYDPTAMVAFFERMKAEQKRKQSAVSKAFSSHPPTTKRIKLIQETMGEILPERPQYALSSSEFDQIKQRLARMSNRTREEQGDPDRPTLRRSPPSATVEPGAEDGESGDDRPVLRRREAETDEAEEDERPTLKRSSLSD